MMYILVGIFGLIFPSILCDCNLEPSLCTTDTCELLANEIFWQMNLTADNEADPKAFYCSQGSEPIGYDSPRWQLLMRRALTEKQEGPKILESGQKLYKSCTDIEQRDKRGFKTLLKFMDEIGGFPMFDKSWNETGFDLNKAIAIWHAKHNAYSFVEMNIWETGIIIQRVDHWFSREKDILRGAIYLLNKQYSDEVWENLKEAFDFDAALWDAYTNSPFDSVITSIGNFSSEPLTSIKWDKVFKLFSSMTGIPINNAKQLEMNKPEYFMEKLPQILEKTPKKVIANYFGLRLIDNYNKYLTTDLLRDVDLVPGSMRSYIYSDCVKRIYKTLDPIPEKLFTDKFVSPQIKKELETIFNLVKISVLELVSKLPFMDKETKRRAFKKIQRMKLVIGVDDEFPSEQLFNSKVSVKYPGIEKLAGNDLLEDMATLNSAKVKNDFLQMLLEKAEYSARQNGFDEPSNTLVLRSYALQYPSYIVGAPLVYNLGAIGNYIADQMVNQVAAIDGVYYENGKEQPIFTEQALLNYFGLAKDLFYFERITAEVFPILYKQYLNFVKNDNKTSTRLPGPLKSYGLSANYIMSHARIKCSSSWARFVDPMFLVKIYSKEMMQKC